MSINWHWSEKFGEAVMWNKIRDETYKVNIYSGNCLAIFLYEHEKNDKSFYTLFDFWADTEHMKRCLGIAKGYTDNNYNNNAVRLSTITFYKDKIKSSNLIQILSALSKANFENLLIIIKDSETPFDE